MEDDAYTGGLVNSVLIVGVSDGKANRKMFEQHFKKQFVNNGVEAVASVDVIFPDIGTLCNVVIKSLRKYDLIN